MTLIRFKLLDYNLGEMLPTHVHEEGQLLFARNGTMEVKMKDQFVMIPPSRIAFVPPHTEHSIRFRSNTKMRTAFINPVLLNEAFNEVRVMQATGLLREVLIKLVEETLFDQNYRDLLENVLITELNSLTSEPFLIKFPNDRRARRVADALLENPESSFKIDQWADVAACSSKTLGRLFIKETGLTFQLWRRHLRLLLIHDLLENGLSVTQAAHAVGFSTSSALSEAHSLTFGFPPTDLLKKTQR